MKNESDKIWEKLQLILESKSFEDLSPEESTLISEHLAEQEYKDMRSTHLFLQEFNAVDMEETCAPPAAVMEVFRNQYPANPSRIIKWDQQFSFVKLLAAACLFLVCGMYIGRNMGSNSFSPGSSDTIQPSRDTSMVPGNDSFAAQGPRYRKNTPRESRRFWNEHQTEVFPQTDSEIRINRREV